MATQIISPIDIATNGVLSLVALDRTNDDVDNTVESPALSIATMGWIVFIEEVAPGVPVGPQLREPLFVIILSGPKQKITLRMEDDDGSIG